MLLPGRKKGNSNAVAVYVFKSFPDPSFPQAGRKGKIADKFVIGYLFHPTL